MLYYHQNTNRFSDEATPAERRNFRTWDKRGNAAEAYAAHGWLPIAEAEPKFDNSPLTGPKARVVSSDFATFSYQVDGQPWQNKVDDAAKLERSRATKLQQLNQWWDDHPGIEVATDIVLPIQEIGRNTNTAALTLALVMQSDPIELVSVDDYTVTIPAANATAALTTFKTIYAGLSSHWDTTDKALKAATTLAQIEAIEVRPS